MRRNLLAVAVVVFMITTIAGSVPVSAGSCDDQEVLGFDPQDPITGSARLCINRKGLRGRMWVGNLAPGNAYTVWWAYFDDPSQCDTPGACGPPDFGGENPLGVFGRMDSVVANGSGEAIFYNLWGGMKVSNGSQIWMLIVGHGEADMNDGRHLARQTLTPEDPLAGAPHLGNVVDGLLGFPAAIVVFVRP